MPDFELKHLPAPSRKARIETYLWDERDGTAEELAETLHVPHRPLASTVVLIPVAAEQERESLGPALCEYAQQTDCEPFSVVLLLNHRTKIDNDRRAAAQTTIDEAYRLQKQYTDQLDLRIATQTYSEPTIGNIRKDLWDAVLSLAHTEGAFDDETGEVVGINHDIDTIAINPHYIKNIQARYTQLQKEASMSYLASDVLPPQLTRVRHYKPYDTHPHTSAGIYWIDTAIEQIPDIGGYEEGIVIPLTYYASRGGFSRHAKTYETHPFITNVGKRLGTIASTDMLTSPRRYIDRFPRYGYDGIWSNETFSDTDDCREATGRDATKTELINHVARVLPDHVDYYYIQSAIRRADREFITQAALAIYSDEKLTNFLPAAENMLETTIMRSLRIAEAALVHMGLESLSKAMVDKDAVDALIAKELLSLEKAIRRFNDTFWEESHPRLPIVSRCLQPKDFTL